MVLEITIRGLHGCPGVPVRGCGAGSSCRDVRWHYGRVPGAVTEVEYEIPWSKHLALSRPDAGHVVGELLPPGFDRYLRIFHPFVSWDAEPNSPSEIGRRTSWEDLATQAGVPFGPTLTWRQLEAVLPLSPDGQSRPWAVWAGYLDRTTSDALFESLDDGANGSYYIAFGLAAINATDEHRPIMFQADSLEARREVVDRVREMGAASVEGPEHVWPGDQSWIVCSDYDLSSTYVAAPHHSAIRIMHNPVIEALEVDLETRVDDRADEQGQ